MKQAYAVMKWEIRKDGGRDGKVLFARRGDFN